jgi:AraC-like DNA-binding protein
VPLNLAIIGASTAVRERSTVDVRLARVDAPLGRALRADEHVGITWTLHHASDDGFADGADRRQHRLRRLLEEAARQGGAPTDADLAAALGVSRRTIVRDMQAMSIDAPPTTRRRRP